jgi:NosR/NirI family nitrous oxide reductase transcriptional regulator
MMQKRLFLVLLIVFSAFATAQACDFNFKVNGNKKDCKPGDVIEITVELALTHRVCNVAPAETKFKVDGMKVLSASQWKQTSPTRYERTVTAQVLNDNKKRITLMAVRTCTKEGGTGTFTLPKD